MIALCIQQNQTPPSWSAECLKVIQTDQQILILTPPETDLARSRIVLDGRQTSEPRLEIEEGAHLLSYELRNRNGAILESAEKQIGKAIPTRDEAEAAGGELPWMSPLPQAPFDAGGTILLDGASLFFCLPQDWLGCTLTVIDQSGTYPMMFGSPSISREIVGESAQIILRRDSTGETMYWTVLVSSVQQPEPEPEPDWTQNIPTPTPIDPPAEPAPSAPAQKPAGSAGQQTKSPDDPASSSSASSSGTSSEEKPDPKPEPGSNPDPDQDDEPVVVKPSQPDNRRPMQLPDVRPSPSPDVNPDLDPDLKPDLKPDPGPVPDESQDDPSASITPGDLIPLPDQDPDPIPTSPLAPSEILTPKEDPDQQDGQSQNQTNTPDVMMPSRQELPGPNTSLAAAGYGGVYAHSPAAPIAAAPSSNRGQQQIWQSAPQPVAMVSAGSAPPNRLEPSLPSTKSSTIYLAVNGRQFKPGEKVLLRDGEEMEIESGTNGLSSLEVVSLRSSKTYDDLKTAMDAEKQTSFEVRASILDENAREVENHWTIIPCGRELAANTSMPGKSIERFYELDENGRLISHQRKSEQRILLCRQFEPIEPCDLQPGEDLRLYVQDPSRDYRLQIDGQNEEVRLCEDELGQPYIPLKAGMRSRQISLMANSQVIYESRLENRPLWPAALGVLSVGILAGALSGVRNRRSR